MKKNNKMTVRKYKRKCHYYISNNKESNSNSSSYHMGLFSSKNNNFKSKKILSPKKYVKIMPKKISTLTKINKTQTNKIFNPPISMHLSKCPSTKNHIKNFPSSSNPPAPNQLIPGLKTMLDTIIKT